MKFKSLNNIFQDAKKTFQRFSWALLSSFAGATAMIAWFYLKKNYRNDSVFWEFIGHEIHWDELSKLAMTATLGITLFLSIRVFSEIKKIEIKQQRWINLFAFLILGVYFVTLLGSLKGEELYRFYLINANLHLLVAIAPFLFERQLTNAFWQYNKSLFLRVGICAIYSSTIYIGCVIAITCLNSLFNLHIKEYIYFQLWFLVMGVFNTWFFLGGVPKDIAALENEEDYPKGLRIFTQFILIPLVVLYYAILYLYMGKIIVTWNLPVGWLSSFIIGASLLGILTLLLIYPLRKRSDFGWIKTYAKYFYLALLPLVVLMAVAIFRRISDYGVTIERYFVLLFTVWLFYVSLRFTFKPYTNIRLIPTSMCILIVMATFGPLSATSVSLKSQLGRLEHYLTQNGYLVDGMLVKGKKKVSLKETAEISSIVEYLYRMHGLGVLNRWVGKSDDFYYMDHYSFVRNYLGLEFIERYQRRFDGGQSGQIYFYYKGQLENVISVEGFDYLLSLQGLYSHQTQDDKHWIETPKGRIKTILVKKDNSIGCFYGDNHFSFDLNPLLEELRETTGVNGHNVETKKMIYEYEDAQIKVRLILSSINGQYVKEKALVNSVHGQMLIKFKEK